MVNLESEERMVLLLIFHKVENARPQTVKDYVVRQWVKRLLYDFMIILWFLTIAFGLGIL